jgi:hypothetical protein
MRRQAGVSPSSTKNPREEVLDALARTGAAFLRTSRSQVGSAAELTGLPSISAAVSVFVDDVESAVEAVGEGASDLLLRDWSQERIGELRDTLDVPLVERTLFPVGLEIGEARDSLPKEIFTAWLSQVDASGAVRPRYEWAPGKNMSPPVPAHRLSSEWTDAVWVDGLAPEGLAGAGELRPILGTLTRGNPADRERGGAAVSGPGRPGRCRGSCRRLAPAARRR